MQSRNIVLIGMPGVGKSTVGVLLAKTLKRPFLDTDLVIQTREDRYLQEIIEQDGMEGFLDIEERAICDLRVRGHVIATGGSVVYLPRAMAHLKEAGLLIYLALPSKELETRVTNITTRGIAMRPGQSLADLYAERLPLYEQYAHITIDTSGSTPEEVVTRLSDMLRRA